MSRDGIRSSSAIVEVALPIPVSHAWISFACKKAALARPRWDVARRVWTTTAPEPLTISTPGGRQTLRIEGAPDQEDAMRRLVSALVVGMMQRARTSAR